MAETDATAATPEGNMLTLTSKIVSAYIGNNPVPAAELSGVIRSVHGTLSGLSGGQVGTVAMGQKPAVPIKKSITPDYIVCLEDGKKLKMLKRYLRGTYKLTPDEYRAKWGLPRDYPMVAPNYAAKRSDLAKKSGLGRSKTAAPSKRRKRT